MLGGSCSNTESLEPGHQRGGGQVAGGVVAREEPRVRGLPADDGPAPACGKELVDQDAERPRNAVGLDHEELDAPALGLALRELADSRTLPAATGHTLMLTRTAYDLYATLGLQRARARAISLRAQGLRPAEDAPRQLTFDPDTDRSLAIEAVADRARKRFGEDAIKPASLAHATR